MEVRDIIITSRAQTDISTCITFVLNISKDAQAGDNVTTSPSLANSFALLTASSISLTKCILTFIPFKPNNL